MEACLISEQKLLKFISTRCFRIKKRPRKDVFNLGYSVNVPKK